MTVFLGCTIGGAIVSVPEYAPVMQWSRTYGAIGDWPPAFIESVSNGGYITGCRSVGSKLPDSTIDPYPHILVVKIDTAGYSQWNRTYIGPRGDVMAHAQQTSDGGYVVTGWTDRNVNGSWGTYALLIKTSESGLPLWNRTYGPRYGNISDNLALYVEQTADGGYVIAGTSWVPTIAYDFWLAKTDSNGNLQWNKTYVNGMALFVYQVEDGGFVVAGHGGWSDGPRYFCLLRTDSAGNMKWNYTYDQGMDIYASSAARTSDGGYVMAGNTDPFGPSSSGFVVVKTDGNGTLEWQHKYIGDWNQACYGVLQTSDGGYVLAGETSKPNDWHHYPLLVRTDGRGTVQWMKRTWEIVSVSASANSVVQSTDGGYVIAGSLQPDWSTRANLWIAKLAPTLSYQTAPALVFVLILVAAVLEFFALVVLIDVVASSAPRHRTSGSVTRY